MDFRYELKIDRGICKASLLCTLEMEWAYGSWLIKLLNVGCLITIFGISYLNVCEYICICVVMNLCIYLRCLLTPDRKRS